MSNSPTHTFWATSALCKSAEDALAAVLVKLNEVVTEELGPGARTISISHHMAVISPPAHSADSLIKTLFKDTPIQPTVAQYQASITAVCESASA